TAQQKVAVKVSVTDDVGVGKVKWAAGTQGESYFTNSGTEIANDSIVNITSNGYYTFYAEDQVGNKQVYTLNVTNVDLTAPTIDIQVSPETTVGLNANVTINYGDSTIKQYKVGTSNATWTNYTAPFAISSYTILSNNWQNADGTVTIYAKGKDSAGNEITVQKKVVSLDLDKPTVPIIQSNSGYAVLTSYGVIIDAKTTITYDTRTDIDNYYSIDNGINWLKYTGEFNIATGTVIAKSVKKSTGLEVIVSKTISMPADAILKEAYDGNDSTSEIRNNVDLYMQVDSSMGGKNIRFKGSVMYAPISLTFLNENKTEISSISRGSSVDEICTIPVGTQHFLVLMVICYLQLIQQKL
ncbi:MAG: putative S-layer protein, partial [Clostridia bacterium]|nr:putative S-layer protein [Clostridia bacterium]